MRILLFGGTGAMGNFLAKVLCAIGHDVFVTTRKDVNKCNGIVKNLAYLQGDAHDNEFIKHIMQEHWDVLVDFMAYSTEEFAQRFDMLLNKVGHYIFLSSSRVYADSSQPITEACPRLLDVCKDKKHLASDEYALSKAKQEDMLRNSVHKNWTIIRPYITYSEERLQLGVFEKEFWLYRALQGKPIVFSKDIAECYTTMTYGSDVANGIAMLIGNDKAMAQTFHIVNECSMKWRDILNLYLDVIEEFTDKRPSVFWIDNMDQLEKIMNNHYQVHCDRLYDRRFNSSKLDGVCGVRLQYTPMELGIAHCLRSFLKGAKRFRNIGWYAEAYMDKITGSTTCIDNIPLMKHKAGYLFIRYMPFPLSCAILRTARK